MIYDRCTFGWNSVTLFTASIPDALFWNTEHPHLYTCICELLSPEETILDHQETTFGFRTAEFRADGFYLNGEKTFLRGLNRHQCYPYVGYAASASLQREDVRILQEELGCNAVRTSHYPQSQHFLDECDRLLFPGRITDMLPSRNFGKNKQPYFITLAT